MTIARHTTIADITGDSWRFFTRDELSSLGATYDPASNTWQIPLPADWYDRVEEELESMGAIWVDGEPWLPPTWSPNDLRRLGYYVHPTTKKTRKVAPAELRRLASRMRLSYDDVAPQYRESDAARRGREFRDNPDSRKTQSSPAEPATPKADTSPNPKVQPALL